MFKAVLVAVCALSVGACATVQPGPSLSKTATPGADTDTVKVASVNQWAQDRHATVVWLHYPTMTKEPDRVGVDH
jgi:hypothetical protein